MQTFLPSYEFLKHLHSISVFNLQNINNKKKKTIISQEVYDKMIQFDIDTSPYIIET